MINVQTRIRSIRVIEIKREIMKMYLMFGTLVMLVVGVNAAGRGKKHTIDSFKYFLNIKGCGQTESSR